jgi:hypothetical protein
MIKRRSSPRKETRQKYIEKFTKWIALIGGSLGILSCLLVMILNSSTIFDRFRPLKHALSIQVPRSDIANWDIQFGIKLRNSGDYNEVITNYDCYFVKNYELSGKQSYVEVIESERMILLDSKKSLVTIIRSNLDLNKSPFNILLKDNMQYTIILRFNIVSEQNNFVAETVPIGMIQVARNPRNRLLEGDLKFISAYKDVDFSHSKPAITLATLPRTTDYDLPKFKIVK